MIFENLTEEEVKEYYEKLKSQGVSEDDIFDEIYSLECNKDEEDNEEEMDLTAGLCDTDSAEDAYNSVILMHQKQADKLKKMMAMDSKSIRKVYGYKEKTVFTFRTTYSHFPSGMRTEIRLVVDERPYAEAVLFDHGKQVMCTEPCYDNVLGIYSFAYKEDNYTVMVKVVDSEV